MDSETARRALTLAVTSPASFPGKDEAKKVLRRPEPGTLLLLGSGLAVLGIGGRRRWFNRAKN